TAAQQIAVHGPLVALDQLAERRRVAVAMAHEDRAVAISLGNRTGHASIRHRNPHRRISTAQSMLTQHSTSDRQEGFRKDQRSRQDAKLAKTKWDFLAP